MTLRISCSLLSPVAKGKARERHQGELVARGSSWPISWPGTAKCSPPSLPAGACRHCFYKTPQPTNYPASQCLPALQQSSPQTHVGIEDAVVELLLVGVDELAHLLLVQDLVQHLGLPQPQLQHRCAVVGVG